jgi:hypothetical protein
MIVAVRECIEDAIVRAKLLAPQVAEEVDRINHLWECALLVILNDPTDRAELRQHLDAKLGGCHG